MEAILLAIIPLVIPFFLERYGTDRADARDKKLQDIALSMNQEKLASSIENRRILRLERAAEQSRRSHGVHAALSYSLALVTIGGGLIVFYIAQHFLPSDINNALYMGVIFVPLGIIALLIALAVEKCTKNKDKNPERPETKTPRRMVRKEIVI